MPRSTYKLKRFAKTGMKAELEGTCHSKLREWILDTELWEQDLPFVLVIR